MPAVTDGLNSARYQLCKSRSTTVPRELHGKVAWRYRGALALNHAEAAEKELRALASWLEEHSTAAAASLREGMEELFTLQRLGMRDVALIGSLSSTNLIESAFSRCEAWTSRVSRWRGQSMASRWAAGALLWAEAGFRRIRGHAALSTLRSALNLSLEPRNQAASTTDEPPRISTIRGTSPGEVPRGMFKLPSQKASAPTRVSMRSS
jgi:hypothetical protein